MKNKLLVLLTMSFFSLSHSAVAKGSQSNNSAVDTIKRLYVQDGFPPYQNRHDAFTPALRRLLELEQQASERLLCGVAGRLMTLSLEKAYVSNLKQTAWSESALIGQAKMKPPILPTTKCLAIVLDA